MQTSQGKPSGTGRCLANALPRWLLKRRGRAPSLAAGTASLPAPPDPLAPQRGGWALLRAGEGGHPVGCGISGKGQLTPKVSDCGTHALNLPIGVAAPTLGGAHPGCQGPYRPPIPNVGLLLRRCSGKGVLVFKGTSMVFSIVALPIYIPTNSVGDFPFLHTLSSIYCL